MPAAVAGSLALLLGATPAHAGEPVRGEAPSHRMLGALDRSAAVAPASARVQAAPAPATCIVQPGDTVTAIATRHGLRTVDVLALNGLDWSSVIHPGQVLALGAAPVAAAPNPADPGGPAPSSGSYVVAGGDTISSIADRHGVSVQDVFAANGLGWASIIYPGQTLAIPGAAPAAPVEVAVPVAPAPTPVAPSAASHVVVAGDTVSAIAARHGVSVASVLAANGLTPASIIYPGQTIAIPVAISPELVADVTPIASPASGLDAEQAANAQIIISVGRELGVPDRGIAIALGTAMQESWLRNLDWGDRDSLGLFQQRPSTGWGTPDEVRDPVRAARAFYGGPSDPNGFVTRGLLDIDGWQSLSFADAAQAVQISAYPDRYAQWEQPASVWLAVHG
ncbi:LysM peptidoglycan-binding domain-containing protein [Microbacterium sp. zg.B48]|uniref:LysM peptidoglycan-binding domain-containing protein n=1 Tax=Microbacterium sp. zg.B48 TaxID=2969408 RepID=UPI00214C19F5|nr:LysM peptidoglycan-binding domain-containing protein [Microbacterium sp. zg.B48]MCR2763422.1 LysM peptidoglycan-binding domain-containing protein [Microbacterium sp. zg.B48]